jgi:hypothetical protein
MWMKCPASCQPATVSTAPGYGSEPRIWGSECVSRTAGVELLGLEAVDLPHHLLLVGDRDAEAALRDLLEQVPVVVEGGVDVDGDAHRGGWVR